jgi:hypothetical protein
MYDTNSESMLDCIAAGMAMNVSIDPECKLVDFSPEKLLAQGRFHIDLKKGLEHIATRSITDQENMKSFVNLILMKDHPTSAQLVAMGQTFSFKRESYGYFLSTKIHKTEVTLMARGMNGMAKESKQVRFSDFYVINGNSKGLSEIVNNEGEGHLILLHKISYEEGVLAAMGLAASRQWIMEP